MTLIHPLSTALPLPEFDVFAVPPTQLAIVEEFTSEIRPLAEPSLNHVLTFLFESAVDEYVRLNESVVWLKLEAKLGKQIQGDATDEDWTKVSCVQNLAHSMWKYVTLDINNRTVTSMPQTYSYMSYFLTLLSYTESAKKSHLSTAGWYPDTTKAEVTTGFNAKRTTLLKSEPIKNDGSGRVFELMFRLHLPLATQGKALLGGLRYKLSLLPNNQNFFLMSKDADAFKPSLELKEALFIVRRAKVSEQLLSAHQQALSSAPACYPLLRCEVKAFNIGANTSNRDITNVVNGTLPRLLHVAFVKNLAVLGDLTKNPYNFEHFKLNHICLFIDGAQIPKSPVKFDFEKSLTLREFYNLHQAKGGIETDAILNIDRDNFEHGLTIFSFNLSADLSESFGRSGYCNLIKRGNMTIQLRFAAPLTETITCLVFLEYDSFFKIYKNGDIEMDYM